MTLSPGLYVVATPIGNLRDITLRALDVLKAADVIAAEDTRVTRNLLAHYDISTPLIAYHDHNAEHAGPQILNRLQNGQTVALVSDAGTPLIADPGYKLVRKAHEMGFFVTAIPGPSSILAALTVSGLPTDRFHFCGFPPAKRSARQRRFAEWAAIDATLVILEGAARLSDSLMDLAQHMGQREAAVARELSKRFETIYRAPVAALAQQFADSDPVKGEVVIVVAPPAAGEIQAELNPAELRETLKLALRQQSLKDAVAAVAENTGMARRKIYREALAVKAEMESQ